MDFVKILRSFEEFLYEVLTWLLFYPRTLWRVLCNPLAMMRYSDGEQNDAPENQYRAAISPPLFLIISIIVAHLLELGAHNSAALQAGFRSFFQADQTFLLLRCIVFGLYPLTFAAALIRHLGVPLGRTSLRAPFFAQCYVGAPYALMLSAAGIGGRMKDPPGGLGVRPAAGGGGGLVPVGRSALVPRPLKPWLAARLRHGAGAVGHHHDHHRGAGHCAGDLSSFSPSPAATRFRARR